MRNNPYWDNICKIAEKQRQKGLDTYGQGLEDNKELSFNERIEYLEEELVDALMYLEHLKAGIKGMPSCLCTDQEIAESFKEDVEAGLSQSSAIATISCYGVRPNRMRKGLGMKPIENNNQPNPKCKGCTKLMPCLTCINKGGSYNNYRSKSDVPERSYLKCKEDCENFERAWYDQPCARCVRNVNHERSTTMLTDHYVKRANAVMVHSADDEGWKEELVDGLMYLKHLTAGMAMRPDMLCHINCEWADKKVNEWPCKGCIRNDLADRTIPKTDFYKPTKENE